jgi:hypothetical protein
MLPLTPRHPASHEHSMVVNMYCDHGVPRVRASTGCIPSACTRYRAPYTPEHTTMTSPSIQPAHHPPHAHMCSAVLRPSSRLHRTHTACAIPSHFGLASTLVQYCPHQQSQVWPRGVVRLVLHACPHLVCSSCSGLLGACVGAYASSMPAAAATATASSAGCATPALEGLGGWGGGGGPVVVRVWGGAKRQRTRGGG